MAVDGDPTLPSRDTLTGLLTDPDGMFGFPRNGRQRRSRQAGLFAEASSLLT